MSNDDTARSIFEQNAVDPVFLPSALSDVASDFEDASAAAGLVASARLQGKVGKKAKTAAIVLAGGSGERFGHDGGKQIVEIAGRPRWHGRSWPSMRPRT